MESDDFDRELERIHRENPEAVAKMIAKADADLAAGRCEPGGFAPDEECPT
jgi:hypothetical protein